MRGWLVALGVVVIAGTGVGWWACSDAPEPAVPEAVTGRSNRPREGVAVADLAPDATAVVEGASVRVVGIDGGVVAGAAITVLEGDTSAVARAETPCGEKVLDCRVPHELADVALWVKAPEHAPKVLATLVSGPDGVAQLPPVPAGQVGVTVRASDGRGLDTTIVPSAGGLDDLEIDRVSVQEISVTDAFDESVITTAKLEARSTVSLEPLVVTTMAPGRFEVRTFERSDGPWLLASAPKYVLQASRGETELLLSKAKRITVRTLLAGRPVEAEVELSTGLRQKTSGGVTVFEGVGGDELEVTAFAEGLASESRYVDLLPDDADVELELRRAARVLASVVDEHGLPIADAQLMLSCGNGNLSGTSDASGALVVLGPVAEGVCTLSADTPERSWTKELDLVPGDLQLEVVLAPPRAPGTSGIDGVVLGADGPAEAQVEGPVSATSTDETGHFHLEVGEPGPVAIWVTAPDGAFARQTITSPAKNVVIRLSPGGALEVRVSDGAGPVEGLRLGLEPQTPSEGPYRPAATTDEAGLATFEAPPGPYHLMVRSEAHLAVAPMPVQVSARQRTPVTVKLDRGASLSGTVRVEGLKPDERRPHVQVTAHPKTQRTPDDFKMVGVSSETFTLNGLRVDAVYEIDFIADPGWFAEAVKEAKPGSTVQITMRRAPMMAGRVVDERGQPIRQFLIAGDRAGDAEGRFSVACPAPADWPVLVSAEGRTEVSIEGPCRPDLGLIRLGPASALRGVVVDREGKPVAGAEMSLSDGLVSASRTNAEGRFEIFVSSEDVSEDTLVVAARASRAGSVKASFGRELRIELEAGVTVTGSLVDARGRGYRGVVAVSSDVLSQHREVETGDDGRFETVIAPGLWRFESRQSPGKRTVQVSEGTVVRLGPAPGTCDLAVRSTQGRLFNARLRQGATSLSVGDQPGDVELSAFGGGIEARGITCGRYGLSVWGMEGTAHLQIELKGREVVTLPPGTLVQEEGTLVGETPEP